MASGRQMRREYELRHEKHSSRRDGREAVLRTKDGTISPAAILLSRAVDDQGANERSQSIRQRRETGKDSPKSKWCDLFTGESLD